MRSTGRFRLKLLHQSRIHHIAEQRPVVIPLVRRLQSSSARKKSLAGSTKNVVPAMPPQKYSPLEPACAATPSSSRTAKPRPKPWPGGSSSPERPARLHANTAPGGRRSCSARWRCRGCADRPTRPPFNRALQKAGVVGGCGRQSRTACFHGGGLTHVDQAHGDAAIRVFGERARRCGGACRAAPHKAGVDHAQRAEDIELAGMRPASGR